MKTAEIQERLQTLRQQITSVIRGKEDIVNMCIVALLARGHVLLEDVPGVGKTTLASTLAMSINCSFQRIQFTSDLLPTDIIGVTIYNQNTHDFEFRSGPLFANIVLADEINRTTPKTQSALLEAMNHGRVTVDRLVHELPKPFMVIATQNPIEFHGTFPLPKSQMDRFLLRLHIGYPGRESEVQILKDQRLAMEDVMVEPVLEADDLLRLQQKVSEVRIDDDLLDYIVRIAEKTRSSPLIELGCSPRGALALRRCAQSFCLLQGRDFVTPDDIKEVAVPVLSHRIQVARTFESGGYGYEEDQHAVRRILEEVEVPL